MRKLSLFLLAMVFFKVCLAGGDPIEGLLQKSGNVKDYPGSNLLIVFDSTQVQVMESGLSYVTSHTLTKVLTARGALDLAVIKFGYDPLSAYVDIRKVVIYRKDGTQEDLDVSKTMDYPAPARMIYWGAREKMIGIGRLDPGDAVEVVEFKKGFTYALLQVDEDEKYIPPMKGQFYDIVEFWSGNPVLTKSYRVTIPQEKLIQYDIYNGELQSSLLREGNKLQYSFDTHNITPFKSEPRMVAASDVAPKLLLSTSPDWYAKSKWFYKVNEDYGSFDVTPDIQAKVSEILKGAVNENDSISRLTHWVADEIRYSGISMGKGEGYTLHKGEMTFTDRCGVCKDKAGMLITLLRAAGFKSYPAMTMAGSRIDYIPADQFNHSVTVVKLKDEKYHLLDPTWVPFVRELWSSAEQQQQYLMGVPEGADLATTPLSPPEKHYLKITGHSRLDTDGTLTGDILLTAEGQTDASVRSFFRYNDPTQWKQIVEREVQKIAPRAEVTDIRFSDPYDYKADPMSIQLNYRIPGYAIVSKGTVIFTPVIASEIFKIFQPQLYFDTDLAERKYPFRDRCSRLVELKEEIDLPPVAGITVLPSEQVKTGKICSFDGGYELSGNHLLLNEKISLGKRIYDASDWPEYRAAVMAENYFSDHPVIFQIKQ
jgi:transglutaminase-like putative cysteine protease